MIELFAVVNTFFEKAMINLLFMILSKATALELMANFLAIIFTFFIVIPLHSMAIAGCTILLGAQSQDTYTKLKFSPFVHQGVMSILALVLVNFAWPTTSYMDTQVLRRRKKRVLICPLTGLIVQLTFAALGAAFLIIAYRNTRVWYEFNEDGLIYVTGSYNNLNNFLGMICFYVVRINLLTAIINLIPLMPFEGYYFLRAFAHSDFRYKVRKIADGVIIATFVIFATTLPQRFLFHYRDILCYEFIFVVEKILPGG